MLDHLPWFIISHICSFLDNYKQLRLISKYFARIIGRDIKLWIDINIESHKIFLDGVRLGTFSREVQWASFDLSDENFR